MVIDLGDGHLIEDTRQEEAEHPELFRMLVRCGNCGSEHDMGCSKETRLEEMAKNGGSDVIIARSCTKCEEQEDDE